MIINELHKQFKELNDLRAREIRVDKQQRKVFCTLSFPNVSVLDTNLKNAVTNYVKTLVPSGYICIVSYVNDSFNEVSFKKLLLELLKTGYPIFSNISKERLLVTVQDRKIAANFSVDEIIAKNMETSLFCERLTDFFKDYTCYEVKINVKVAQDDIISYGIGISEQEKLVQLAINRELLKPSRYFNVSNVEKHIGKLILSAPMYISDIRNASDSCVICGTVSNKTLKASKNDSNMYVCKFTLTDASGGSMPCIIFVRFDISDFKTIKETMGKSDNEAQTLSRTRTLANDKKMKKMMDIYDSMSVIVRGKISFNNYSEQLEMCVYDLCKCNIAPIGNSSKYSRSVSSEYALIKPVQYEEYKQSSFVDKIVKKSLIRDKNLVVLHINGTGVNATKDKVFAVCGVKLTDGHINERFFTYVNPEMQIDESALSKAKITNEKLLFYPTITEIISDLYKFTYGFDLVGTDVNQYMDVLNYYASPLGYKFSNNCVSQTELLSALFDNSVFDKKPNCSKIDDVAKSCKTPCLGVNFCSDTALTVSKCLAVLSLNVR